MKIFLTLTSMCIASAVAAIMLTEALTVVSQRAEATSAFTQQTGKPCAYCHTAPPALNGNGRKFKENGNKLPK